MDLHENQLKLLRHLALFNVLDYPSCLQLLDTAGAGDTVALSYAFRPLSRYGYLTKREDDSVAILAKGRALFPGIRPLVSSGGGAAARERQMAVSRVAMWMGRNGVPISGERMKTASPYFIPSACWRKIASGILSTTRFAGMLLMGDHRYAVYDIGDGHMEWQVRAEGSLFYFRYENWEMMATGMLFICRDEARTSAAENIIRQTMWSRKQLLGDSYSQRSRPTRWSRSPIKLRRQYMHVYLTTPGMLKEDLAVLARADHIKETNMARLGSKTHDPAEGDYENWPTRYFDNFATDLLKYVYFFAAVKDRARYVGPIEYVLINRPKDAPILNIYGDLLASADWVKHYEYRPAKDDTRH